MLSLSKLLLSKSKTSSQLQYMLLLVRAEKGMLKLQTHENCFICLLYTAGISFSFMWLEAVFSGLKLKNYF